MDFPPSLLPVQHPPGASVRERLRLAETRLNFLRLLAKVPAIHPVEFDNGETNLIDLRLAWGECVRYDMPAVEVVSESELKREGGRSLGAVMREHVGTPSTGFLSVYGGLPWVRVALSQPSSGWLDALRKAGANDVLFLSADGSRLFAAVSDGHDPVVHCIATDASELARRAAR